MEDGGSEEGEEDHAIVLSNSLTISGPSPALGSAPCGWSVRSASVPGSFDGQVSL